MSDYYVMLWISKNGKMNCVTKIYSRKYTIHKNEFRFTIKYKISIKNAAFNVVSSFLLDLLHPRVFVCGSFHRYDHGNCRRYNA